MRSITGGHTRRSGMRALGRLRRWCASAVVFACFAPLAACDGLGRAAATVTSVVVSDAADADIATGAAPAAPTVAGDAAATGPSDARDLRAVWRDERTAELTYRDVAGSPRTIVAQLRPPAGSPPAGGWPVLVWSHGGADGKESVARVGDGWTRAFHEAGYLVVAIAHTGRELDERYELCDAIGVVDCDQYKYLTWDRPHDAIAVFDWLEQVAATQPEIDLDRLAYGGHSAGTVSVLAIAGMTGHSASEVQPPSDPRPVVFVAASPPGVMTIGLDESSFAAIDRPVLMLTGAGDDTDGSVGDDRRDGFALLAEGRRGLVWVDDHRARHTTFDLDLSACQRSGGTRAECRSIARAIADLGVAWVDASLDGISPTELRSSDPAVTFHS